MWAAISFEWAKQILGRPRPTGLITRNTSVVVCRTTHEHCDNTLHSFASYTANILVSTDADSSFLVLFGLVSEH